MGSKFYIIVRTSFIGKHLWKDAPLEVDFLKLTHRHVFHIEAKIPVLHDNRQLEFFTVQKFLNEEIKKLYPDGLMRGTSCEMLAEKLVNAVSLAYGIKRDISVAVFEDNENAGVCEI